MKQGITALPEDVRARAVPSTDLNDAAGEYGGGAAEPAPPSGGEAAGTPAAAEPGEDEGKPAEESSDEY